MKIFVRKHSRWPGPLRLTLAWRRQLLGARQPRQSVGSRAGQLRDMGQSGKRLANQPLIISPWESPQMQHVALSPSGEARRLGLAFAAGSMPSTAPAPRRNAIVVGRAVLALCPLCPLCPRCALCPLSPTAMQQ